MAVTATAVTATIMPAPELPAAVTRTPAATATVIAALPGTSTREATGTATETMAATVTPAAEATGAAMDATTLLTATTAPSDTAPAATPRPGSSTAPSAGRGASQSDSDALPVLSAGFYPYKVLPDENWTIVAGRTGVPIDALQAANPQAIRPSEWLLTNEVLEIPVLPQPDWPRASIVLYTVQPGDSWSSIGADLQVSPTLLWAVNPQLRRWWQVLISGDEMIIPPAPAWPPARQ